MLGFPFRPNTSIANTLPISLRAFPSNISWINRGIAISGISRDLNHHILAYRTRALITMADWMCNYQSPIDDIARVGMTTSMHMESRSIPAEWIITWNAMHSFDPPLVLRNKDQSFLIDASGEVSISHIINIASDYHSQLHKIIDGNVLRSQGHSLLEDYGKWEHSDAPSSRCV